MLAAFPEPASSRAAAGGATGRLGGAVAIAAHVGARQTPEMAFGKGREQMLRRRTALAGTPGRENLPRFFWITRCAWGLLG